MSGGTVAPARLRIKGRKQSVFRFFIISVGYTITWITLSSELGYYSKMYGPSVLLLLNIAYYLPSIPVLILSGHVEKAMDKKFGHCNSMFLRLTAGMLGCGLISAYFPFLPFSLSMLLGMVMLLGATSAVAFSTSYQLVGWFRAADTISLGLGCVGSGPLVLLIQIGLDMGTKPTRWQWISLFEIAAGLVVISIFCLLSLYWQYGKIINGDEPYYESLLPQANTPEQQAEEDNEPPPHIMQMMLSPRVMSLADPYSGLPLLSYRKTADEVYAHHDDETGIIRPIRRAASMDSDYSLSTWQAHQSSLLRSKTVVARSNLGYTHYISPPPAEKPNMAATDPHTDDPPSGWDDQASGPWVGFPSEGAASINATPKGSFTTLSTSTSKVFFNQPSGHNISSLSRTGSDISLAAKPASDPDLRTRPSDTPAASSSGDPHSTVSSDMAGLMVPNLAVALARRRHLQAATSNHSSSPHSMDGSMESGEEDSDRGPETPLIGERVGADGFGAESGTGTGSGFSLEGGSGGDSPFAEVQKIGEQAAPALVPRLPTLPIPIKGSSSAEGFPTSFGAPEPLGSEGKGDGSSGATRAPPSPDARIAEDDRGIGGEEGEVAASAPRPPMLKKQPSEVEANLGVLKEIWSVILGLLASSTTLNLLFPFFTYVPTSGLLGDYLPRALFFTRIFADILGRLLPRKRSLTLKSPYALLVLAAMELGVSTAFFFYLKAPPRFHNDLISLGIIAFLWVCGGYINTNSYILAPNMVPPSLCARASAMMALTYQVAHFLGLMLAIVVATVLYGNIAGGL